MKKRLFLGLAALALFAGSLTCASSTIEVQAEGESTSEVVSVEQPQETEAETPSIVSKTSDWIENKVVPLLGGISLGAIASMVVSIFTAFTKFKGDLTNRKIIKNQDQKVEALEQQVEALKKENEEMKAYQEKMLGQFSLVFSETKDKMDSICTYALSITENVEEQNNRIANVENMKGTIEVFCNLTAKMFALSDVAVKSGIAEDAQKLIASFSDNQGGKTDGENS